jgi:hypothetical protein
LRWVDVGSELGIEELEVLDGEGAGVVVHLAVMFRPVVGPAIATIEGVELLDVGFEALLRPLCSVALKSEVGKDAEP